MKAKELIQQITEQVHKNANVRVVFGDPVEKGSITIIPVAKVTVKGGGGGGIGSQNGSISLSAGFISNANSKAQEQKSTEKELEPQDSGSTSSKEKKDDSPGGGMGLGLQVETVPLGYIEIKDDQAKFKEIVDAGKLAISGMVFSGIMFFFITRLINLFVKKSLQQKKLMQKKKPV